MLIKKSPLFLLAGLVALGLASLNLDADDAKEKNKKNDPSEFRLPASTLETSTRLLDAETDLYKRFQLLLRWIKIKEEVDKTLIASGEDPKAERFKNSKREVIVRVEGEILKFQGSKLPVVQLYRELGFRFQELGDFKKSIAYFEQILKRTPEDQLAYGDALLAGGRTQDSLDAYELASRDIRFKGSAAYKRAWAFMRLAKFAEALGEFDLAITQVEHNSTKLRAEAYRDRIRAFLETYKKTEFDQLAASELKALAVKVTPEDASQQKKSYSDALKDLVDGFNSRGEIEKAQNAFYFLSLEIKDTTEVLLLSAPTWIKIYRGRLDHASVERVLAALPEKEMAQASTQNIRAELYNTAVFYETFNEKEDREEASRLLLRTYNKYFVLYPTDSDADPLRVNFSRMLLERGEADRCLNILVKRSGKEVEVEKLASTLEGKCELKHLDQLYAKPHDDLFRDKLQNAIITSKIYLRPDLGMTSLQAFEALARMLIGTLQKNPSLPKLRIVLESLLKEYPFEDQKESALYSDLQTASAELRFKDVLDSKMNSDLKADAFYAIFVDAKRGTEVAQKSLTNSITLGQTELVLERCDKFKAGYGVKFFPADPVFERCVQLSEHYLNIEKEYSYWIFNEAKLNESQKLRVGLLELAQSSDSKGRARIKKIGTPEAKQALELWDGIDDPAETTGSQWLVLEKKVTAFIDSLKPIKFAQIPKLLPKSIWEFEKLDSSLIEYSNSKPPSLGLARVFEARARASSKMADWIVKLPEPPGLEANELAEYKVKAGDVIKGWTDRAEKRKLECGETAHTLTANFKADGRGDCIENTADGKFREVVNAWRKTIPNDRLSTLLVKSIAARAAVSKEPLKARYYLFRALALSRNDFERAMVHSALARLTKSARFWKQAYALDPGQPDAIEYYLSEAKGNPFFERLYQWQLREVKLQALNP